MNPYNQNFVESVMSLLDLRDKVVLEIGCGNGDDLRWLAEQSQPKKIIGIDKYLESWWATQSANGENWEVRDGDAMNLEFPDETFDVVISLATFEHIADVEKAMSEIKRVLKPYGKFYTTFSPIWTSILGHHYDFWTTEERAKLIPPWGHLWMSKEEMYDHLVPKIGDAEARQACVMIYESEIINRVSRNELFNIFINSGMYIRMLNEHIAFSRTAHFGNRVSELTDDVRSKLIEHKLNPAELAIFGFTLLMEKYAVV